MRRIYRNSIKNKKGFSLAEVLFYAIMSVLIFSLFFTFVGGTRSANMDMVDKNDILSQIYNIEEEMLKDIKYANDIHYYTGVSTDSSYAANQICAKGDVNCATKGTVDKTKIRLIDKDGNYEKEYAFLPPANNKPGKIVLSDNKNNQVTQYEYIEDASFELVKNSSFDIKAIEITIKFKKNQEKYNYKITLTPNAWINKSIDPITGGLKE